jgi:DcmR-like sensory protein
MGLDANTVRGVPPPQPAPCRLVVRTKEGSPEILNFVVAGLEAGQQVFAVAGAARLKELAHRLGENGLRPDTLLRNGRLVFLTAPACLPTILKPGEEFQRGPLHRNGTLLRWVSDWSWAYSNGSDLPTVLSYQRRIHEVVRSLTSLSLCTVDSEKLERSSLLAMLADHRRASRGANGK